MSDFATVILMTGERYETPVENLENVRRMLGGKYKQIILPGEEEETEVEETPAVRRGRGKGKK